MVKPTCISWVNKRHRILDEPLWGTRRIPSLERIDLRQPIRTGSVTLVISRINVSVMHARHRWHEIIRVFGVVHVCVRVCWQNWARLTGSIALVDHRLDDSTPRVDEPVTDQTWKLEMNKNIEISRQLFDIIFLERYLYNNYSKNEK